MAFKLTKGGMSSAWQKPASVQKREAELAEPGLLGRLGLSLVEGLESPLQALQSINELLGGSSLTRPAITQEVARLAGVDPGKRGPESTLESFGQNVLKQGPMSALFGPGALVANVLGNVVGTGLEAGGAPEWAQTVGQIGTELGTSLYGGKLPGVGRFLGKKPLTTLGKKQQTAYTAAERAVPVELRGYEKAAQKLLPETSGIQTAVTPIVETISDVKASLKRMTNVPAKEKIADAVKTIEQNFTPFSKGMKINPRHALELRRNLNADVRDLMRFGGKDRYALPGLRKLPQSINNFFAKYSLENPDFYKHLSKADQLTNLKYINTTTQKLIKKLPSKGGLQKIAFGLLGPTLEEGEKIVRRLATRPDIMFPHYANLIFTLGSNAPVPILQSFSQFIQAANEADIPISYGPDKEKNKTKNFKLSKGGLNPAWL